VTNIARDPHPAPETLAAFVDGNLHGAELIRLSDHLRDCEQCRRTAGAAVRFTRHEPARLRSRRWIWSTAAAVVTAAVLLVVVPRLQDPLREFQPTGGRSYQGRFTAFEYAPYRVVRSTKEPGYRQLAAAARLQDSVSKGRTARNMHRFALAQAALGDSAEAASLLLEAARLEPNDAAILSDLSGAEIEQGQYDLALKYADLALRVDPRHRSALFNRAVALEYLGPVPSSIEAWRRYLAVDSAGPWADEARNHLRDLEKPQSSFAAALNDLYAAPDRDGKARDMVAKFPLESRTWTEGELLARWGDAIQKGDSVSAARHLQTAFALANALVASSGERLALDAVDAVSRNPRLAEAHTIYRYARIAYSEKKPARAEPGLLHAAKLFAAEGSPMAFVARYYAANVAFDENRTDESAKSLAAIAREIPESYRALNAQVRWEQGLCELAAGRTSACLATLAESALLFARNRESANEADVMAIASDSRASIGDFENARSMRARALHMLRSADPRKYVQAVMGASGAAVREGDFELARSFLNVEIATTQRLRGLQQAHVDALLRRAVVNLHVQDRNAARVDLQRASITISAGRDEALLQRESADYEFVLAQFLIDQCPIDAIRFASRALEFHRRFGRTVLLPDIYLTRGRARQRAHDYEGAAADYSSGIDELEKLRRDSPSGRERWGIFDSSSDLVGASVALDLQIGAVDNAWRTTDRVKARGLLDTLDHPLPLPERSDIPAHATIIEYGSIGDRLIGFAVTGEEIIAFRVALAPQELAATIDRFSSFDGSSDRNSQALYEQLIRPIPERLLRRLLVFVPTDPLYPTPFAALIHPASRRRIIEDHEVVVALSAATFLANSRTEPPRPHFALIISSTAGAPGMSALPAAQAETQSIARLYENVTFLLDRQIAPERLGELAREADIIHFAGHADAATGRLYLAEGHAIDEQTIPPGSLPRHPTVVLAACDTGKGRLQRTEGPLSIARAFLAAGAHSVVATLAPVDDAEAARFFVRLHERLSRGQPASAALRDTQIEFLRSGSRVWPWLQVMGG
jgi:tetratricopeptide (TPR) repeat protein